MFSGIGSFRDLGNPLDPRRSRSLPTPAAANVPGLPAANASNVMSVLRSQLPDYGENPIPGSRRDRIQQLAEVLQYAKAQGQGNVPLIADSGFQSADPNIYSVGRSQPGPVPDPRTSQGIGAGSMQPGREVRLAAYEAMLRGQNAANARDLSAEAVSANPGDDIVVRRGMENLLQGTRYTDRDKGWGRKTPALTYKRRQVAGSPGFNPANAQPSQVEIALASAIESASPENRAFLEQYANELANNIAFTDAAQDVTGRVRYLGTESGDPSLTAGGASISGIPSGRRDWRERGANIEESSWTGNDNASVGAEPVQRVGLPVRQSDGQWKILSGPKKGAPAIGYLNPSEIVETRTTGQYEGQRIDPDASAPWDRQKEVSLGGIANELKDDYKTQVIDNVTLNALAAEGRVKRLSPEEIEQRRIENKNRPDSAVAKMERTAIRDGVLLTNSAGDELLAHIEYDSAGAPTGRVVAHGKVIKPQPGTSIQPVGKYAETEEVIIYEPKGSGSRKTLVDVPDPTDRRRSIKEERTLYRVGRPMNRDVDAIREKLRPFVAPGMAPFEEHGGIRRNAEALPEGKTFEEMLSALTSGRRAEEPRVADAYREILADAVRSGSISTQGSGEKPLRGSIASLYSGINPETGRNPAGTDAPAVTAGKQLRAALQEYKAETGQGVPLPTAQAFAHDIGRRWGVSGSDVINAAADPANDPGRALFARGSTAAEILSQAAREQGDTREVDLFGELTKEQAMNLIPETYETGRDADKAVYTGESDNNYWTANAIKGSGPVRQVMVGQKPYASKEASAVRTKGQKAPTGRPQLRSYADFANAIGEEVGSERQERALTEMALRMRAREGSQAAVNEEASNVPQRIDQGVPAEQLNAPTSGPTPDSGMDAAAIAGTPDRGAPGGYVEDKLKMQAMSNARDFATNKLSALRGRLLGG